MSMGPEDANDDLGTSPQSAGDNGDDSGTATEDSEQGDDGQ